MKPDPQANSIPAWQCAIIARELRASAQRMEYLRGARHLSMMADYYDRLAAKPKSDEQNRTDFIVR
jgi:hypothetical protein